MWLLVVSRGTFQGSAKWVKAFRQIHHLLNLWAPSFIPWVLVPQLTMISWGWVTSICVVIMQLYSWRRGKMSNTLEGSWVLVAQSRTFCPMSLIEKFLFKGGHQTPPYLGRSVIQRGFLFLPLVAKNCPILEPWKKCCPGEMSSYHRVWGISGRVCESPSGLFQFLTGFHVFFFSFLKFALHAACTICRAVTLF